MRRSGAIESVSWSEHMSACIRTARCGLQGILGGLLLWAVGTNKQRLSRAFTGRLLPHAAHLPSQLSGTGPAIASASRAPAAPLADPPRRRRHTISCRHAAAGAAATRLGACGYAGHPHRYRAHQ